MYEIINPKSVCFIVSFGFSLVGSVSQSPSDTHWSEVFQQDHRLRPKTSNARRALGYFYRS